MLRRSGNFSVVCIMVMVLCFFCSLFTAAVFAAGNEGGTEVRVIVLDKNEQPESPGGGDSGSSGNGGSSGNKAESISDRDDHGGTGSEENQNENFDSEERESGNLNGSADGNRNAGSGVAEDGEECKAGNANGSVADGKSMGESIRAGDQKGMIDRDSESISADPAEEGAVLATGQKAAGCRCIWARLFGNCVICMLFHHCLRWWCWLIPLLLIVFLGALIFENRKKRRAERKSH